MNHYKVQIILFLFTFLLIVVLHLHSHKLPISEIHGTKTANGGGDNSTTSATITTTQQVKEERVRVANNRKNNNHDDFCFALPQLHISNISRDRQQYEKLQSEYLEQGYGKVHLEARSNPYRIIEEDKETGQIENMFTTIKNNSTFILWTTAARTGVKMSAFNDKIVVKSKYRPRPSIYQVEHVPPVPDFREKCSNNTKTLMGNYIALPSVFPGAFAHFFLDHLSGLAYVKQQFFLLHPEKKQDNIKFLLTDWRGVNRNLFQTIDSKFVAESVEWIDCLNTCDALFHIQGDLTLVTNMTTNRHLKLLNLERDWILSGDHKYPASLLSSLTETTPSSLASSSSNKSHIDKYSVVIYYKRTTSNAHNLRYMEVNLENKIIQMIHQYLIKYNRDEKLVIFDGSISFEEQIYLFRNASTIIGQHGGAFANLIVLPDVQMCKEQHQGYGKKKPQVLEFVSNSYTPTVHFGFMSKSYYHLYSSAPWVDYHHIPFVPPSTNDTVYIDLNDFKLALDAMWGQ